LQWSRVQGVGNCPSPRDKLKSATVGSKIYFFGGFGPREENESEDAEFTWYNDLHTFDTGEYYYKNQYNFVMFVKHVCFDLLDC